tara:strand:- start:45 stop:254 length:210 start_codon:yes stop_codon:yes gene_type:complete
VDSKDWEPTKEEDFETIKIIYEGITEQLSNLQKETGCPDSFIYNFIERIQSEWHPTSCHSVVRNKKRNN